jgi:hypothetical protein
MKRATSSSLSLVRIGSDSKLLLSSSWRLKRRRSRGAMSTTLGQGSIDQRRRPVRARGRDLQRVGRVVGGQYDAVAVDDQAAVGHDRHHRDPVGLGLRRASSSWRKTCSTTRRASSRPKATSTNTCGSQQPPVKSADLALQVPQLGHAALVLVLQGSILIRIRGPTLWRQQRSMVTNGHSAASNTGASSRDQPGNMPPAIRRTTSDTTCAGKEHRQDLHRLFGNAEPRQASVNGDGHEAQQGVGQRVLTQHCASRERPSAARRRMPGRRRHGAAGARSRTPAPPPAGRASPAVGRVAAG